MPIPRKSSPVRRIVIALAIFALTAFTVNANWGSGFGFSLFSSSEAAGAPAVNSGTKTEAPMFFANVPSTANYTFATNTTSSLLRTAGSGVDNIDMTFGAPSLVAASADDTVSAVTTIPFDFYLMGVRYNQFSVNDNGHIRLGGTVVQSGSPYSMPNGTAPILNPLGTDQRVGTDGIITYKVVGSAPNRVLVIQWLNNTLPYPGTTAVAGTATYQTRLYETTGVIEYVYGTMGTGAGSLTTYTVGFSVNTSANNIVSVDTTAHTASTSATVTTNSYTSNSTLTGLTSTANGSRRAYTFTPSLTAVSSAGPLTFTSITGTGMTLNWTDVADDQGYAIYRSTDGGTTYTYQASTASDVTTLTASALQPSQTYFWRVYSIAEGRLSSTPLSNSQATTATGGTYFWTGVSGGDFNTGGNWNTAADGTGTARGVGTTSDVLIVDGAGTTPGGAMTLSVSAAASIGALQVTSSTAVTLQSSAATQRILTITGAAGDDFSIGAGSSLLMTNTANSASIVFATATGMTGTISGTLTVAGVSATASSATANSFLTTGGTGTVVTVANGGVINNTATTNITTNGNVTGSAASLIFANGSAYNVSGATTGAPWIPLATWGSTSTVTISGLTTSTSTATNNLQAFGNFTYNCPAASATLNFFGSTVGGFIQGTLTIQATNTGRFRATSSGIVGVNSLTISAGTFEAVNSTGTLTILGNVTQTGGTFDVTAGTSAGTVKLAGNYTQSGTGVLLVSGSSSLNPVFEFNGTSAQSLTLVNAVTGTLNMRVNNTAGVNLTGSLLLNGLTVSNGNISGGTISYNAATSRLLYNSTTGTQTATATEFPAASGPNNLTINNTNLSPNNTVTIPLNRTLPATGVLTLTAGILANTGNVLTVGNTAVAGIVGGSSTTYVRGGLARTLPASLTGTLTYGFPVGKGTYNPYDLVNPVTTAGGPVVVQAEAFDANSGGTTGLNMGTLNINRYWAASIASGGANFTSSFIRLTDSSVVSASAIASSGTANGVYDIVGGTSPTVVVGTSVTSVTPAATGLPGFFVIGTKAVGMAYVSSTTTQAVTTPVITNTTNQQIIGVQIVTVGNASPLNLSSVSLSTNGTTAPGTDMTNAKLWYTGTTNTFATTTPYGSTVASPSGSFNITGTLALAEGTNYFWLTYDIPSGATVNNVVDAECSAVNVGTSQIPTVQAPTGSRTIKAALNGTYTIGASQTSPNYTKLTDAVADLNLFGVSGAVTFQLAADYSSATETFPLTINSVTGASSTNRITIRPAAGVVNASISGSSATSLVTLNAADWVTINGSNTGVGSDRNLTITNTSTNTASAVVWLQSSGADGATNNSIQNCKVIGSSPTAGTLVAMGAGGAIGAASSAPNNSNKYINNDVSKSLYGIISFGQSAAAKNTGTQVNQNVINTASPNHVGKGGVFIANDDGAAIDGNNISNMAGSGGYAWAISCGLQGTTATTTVGSDVTNATISNNRIGTVRGGSTWGVSGIAVASVTTGTTTIANNMIADAMTNGTSGDIGAGIYIGGGAGSTTNLYFNSISQSSALTGGAYSNFGVAINGSNPTVDMRNNIVSNTGSNGANLNRAIGLAYSTFTNLTSNYNDLIVIGTGSAIGQTGTLSNTGFTASTTLANWQTNTGKDANSINLVPNFLSVTDLHIDSTAVPTINNLGTPIGGITLDIDADTRNVTTPDMGADEFTPPAVPGTVQFSSQTGYAGLEGSLVSINVNRVGGSVGALSVGYSTGGGSATAGAGPGCALGDDYVTSAGQLDWANGESGPKPFTVQLCGDTVPAETDLLQLTLTSISGSVISGNNPVNLNITDVPAMTYSSSTTTQVTGNATLGASNQAVIAVQVVTSGAYLPLSATQFNFNTNGTTSAADITAAKVYYTGTSSTFATGTQFGSTTSNPNGSFTVNGTQVLADGTNYFWLAYDVAPTATVDNFIDGEAASLVVDSITRTPTVTAPAGNRQIKAIVTIPGANTNNGSVRQPLSTWYGFQRSAAIYTPAEIGLPSGSTISNMCWYVNSSSSPINSPTKIYLKTRSTATFAAATTVLAEETGAQLSYDATPALTYAADTFQCLALSTPFVYTGDHLEVIVETNATGGGSGESNTSKQFRYTTSTNAHQVWEADTNPPTGVSTGGSGNSGINSNRPNIQFNYVLPAPTYTVTYNGNGNTSGTAPVDGSGPYTSGATVTVLGAGDLLKTGYSFSGWNTSADGSGTSYAPSATFTAAANVTLYAQWAINQYTLTYVAGANGAISGTTPQTVNHGGSGTAVTAVPNAGYHFVSWSDANTNATRTDTNVTASATYTATFAINEYTLTYVADANGTISGTTPQTVNHGANGSAVTAVPNAGYHFVSWSDANTNATRTDLNVTASATYTATFAINEYTLNYVAGANGTISGTTPQTVNHGANGTAVTAVPNAGYHFVSWSDANTNATRTDTNVTASATYTATFAINEYTLTYLAGANGTISGTTPQTVNHGASGTAVTAVPNSGYHFVSWSDANTNATRTDSNVTASATYTATFAINEYTLTYLAGANGTISGTTPQTVNHGTNGTAVTAVPNVGYHFVSWSDANTNATRTDLNVTASATYTATFAINEYTLTYVAGANGTISGTTPQTVNHGANGTAVTAVPNVGYHFVSWSDANTNATRTDLNVMASATYTATFAINEYTLTYVAGANGTISGTAVQTVNHGANGTAVTAVPNAGYHFVSWSDANTNATRTDTNVTASVTYTATFAINEYTLTYVAGANGTISGITPQTVNHGASGTAVTAVPNTGYHFVSWSDANTNATRTDTNVTASATYTATFAINEYTLTYVAGANGTISGTTPQTVNHGANGTAVTAVPNAGYHFVSWSDANTNATRTDTNVTASATYTATFAINEYTLTYVAGANGTISGTTPQTVNHGASGTAVTAVPNTGYHFVSWSDANTNATRTDLNVTASATYTATFAINEYTLTYVAGANGTILGTTPQTVNHGASGTAVTAVPNTGYHFVSWSDANTNATRTDLNVTASATYTATFAINEYTLTYLAGANGTISGTTPQTVNHGASGTAVTAVPNANYHFVSWSDANTNATRTDMNVTASATYTATFAIDQYTITVTAGANGSITPGTGLVNAGTSPTYTITPNAGYSIGDVIVDGISQGAIGSYQFTNVLANHTISASFTINAYTILASAGTGGSISPSGSVAANFGDTPSFTITPNAGHTIADVLVDGVSVGAVSNYTFTPISANHTIAASFTINTYTITASAGTGGSITPSGAVSATYGTTPSFTISPSSGYSIADVLVDGISVGAVGNYTFMPVAANHTIAASFVLNTYTLTYTAGPNGSISGTSPQTVSHGANGSAVTAVANAGYHFVDWSDASVTNPRTDTNVTANISVTANFAIDPSAIVYVNSAWTGVPNGTDPDAGGPATSMGYDAFATVSGGVAGVATGGEVIVYPGTYTENIVVNRVMNVHGNFTLVGSLSITAPGASVSPGSSPGIINTGNYSMVPATTLNIELNGTTAGTQHDQVNVTGTVNLGGANLAVAVGYSPLPGDQYIIVNNDGAEAVSGIFAGLLQGSTFSSGGNYFSISYTGGTGNDVVLTSIAASYTISTGTQLSETTYPDLATGVAVDIPIYTTDLTSAGVIAADFTFDYNTAMLRSAPASISVTAGSVDPGATVTWNANTPGSVVVSVFSTSGAPFSGGGTVAVLHMRVIGQVGTTMPLTVSAFKYNNNLVNSTIAPPGSLSVVGSVTGKVVYSNAFVPFGVPNVTMTLTGPTPAPTATPTDSNGDYQLIGVGLGSFTVTPTRAPQSAAAMFPLPTGIKSGDAALIAQHVVGITTLTGPRLQAAKVSGLPNVTSFEAALVAQWVVGIPNILNQTGTWKFTPPNRSYTNVMASQTAQGFDALLMGDVNGDWVASASRPAPMLAPTKESVVASVPDIAAAPGSQAVVPFRIDNLQGKTVTSYQFEVAYDPTVIEPVEGSAELIGTMGERLLAVSNVSEPGVLRVAVFGAMPVGGDGIYANLRFTVLEAAGSSTELDLRAFGLNDGGYELFANAGRLTVSEAASGPSITGRLLTASGKPVAGDRVLINDTNGRTRSAISERSGHFVFSGLTAGESYTVSVRSKRFTFTPVTVSVSSGATSLDMIAEQ